MSKVLVTDTHLTNIANAIREKSGETTTYKPSEMAEAITNIKSGPNITKGIVINTCDTNGYAKDISIIGMETIPAYYLAIYSSTYKTVINKQLTRLRLPEELTSIEDYACYNCSNLGWLCSLDGKSGFIPNNITNIGKYAFYSCRNFYLNELPDAITTIGEYAFYGDNGVNIKEIPSGVTVINQHTFNGCYIKNLTCKGAITTINTRAFYGNSPLITFALPNITSVPTLSDVDAFSSTPIASGTGYIYVPDDLVDSFKSATNWSTYADQIKAISELEASA